MIEIYVDGGIKDNHMYVAVICNSETCPIEFSKRLKVGHSHKAEEESLHYCVKIINKLEITEEITIYTDQMQFVSIINSNKLKEKTRKTYPKIQQIKDFISTYNIKLAYVKSGQNLAHSLITEAYKEIYYNNVPQKKRAAAKKSIKSIEESYNAIIKNLKKDLQRKDNLISDLLKAIERLNESTTDF